MKLRSKFLAVFLMMLALSSVAQQSAQPLRPELLDAKFSSFTRRAAYGTYIAEACGFPTTIQPKFKALVELGAENEAKQEMLLDEFKEQRRQHAAGGNLLTTAMPCYIDSAKTRVLISDIQNDIDEMQKQFSKKLVSYQESLDAWRREQYRIAEAQRIEREKQLAQEQEARDAISRIPQLIHSALDCASNFGQVSNVKVTFAEPAAGDRINLRGNYVITTFDVALPGSFVAVAAKSGHLESLWWKENSRSANVSSACL